VEYERESIVKEYLLHLFNTIRVSDILDIGVIAVLTYGILIWLKKTASRFVFFGIIILSVVYMVSRFFHMYLTEYVLRGFFAVFLIIMIIIFQEDLRRFFERLAIWRPRTAGSPMLNAPVEHLVTAIMRLARQRRGALIIIKGRDHLDRHIEGGIPLGGMISTALLESIFDTNSPGHDGAVIIDKDHVELFGCHLPLSKNSKKIGGMGLRHTAALGLSELTDALCIVVSEERGTISIAQAGSIHPLWNHELIKHEIETFYGSQSLRLPEKSRWRWLSSNTWEKGIALGLAAILWLAFGFQTEIIRRDFVIPVSYRNLPADWTIESQEPRETAVSFTGSKQAFDLLDTASLGMLVDMSAVVEGQQVIPLNNRSIVHPSNLSVADIQPQSLVLTAYKLVPRDVPIHVPTSGALDENLVLKGIDVSPETVKVLATRHSPSDLQVSTEAIQLDPIKTTTRLSPKIIQQGNLSFPDRRIPSVTVTVRVEPKANLEQGIQ
jgi:uncharacterized protein (TIGR00159 family)